MAKSNDDSSNDNAKEGEPILRGETVPIRGTDQQGRSMSLVGFVLRPFTWVTEIFKETPYGTRRYLEKIKLNQEVTDTLMSASESLRRLEDTPRRVNETLNIEAAERARKMDELKLEAVEREKRLRETELEKNRLELKDKLERAKMEQELAKISNANQAPKQTVSREKKILDDIEQYLGRFRGLKVGREKYFKDIDADVEAGLITKEEADEIKSAIEEYIKTRVLEP